MRSFSAVVALIFFVLLLVTGLVLYATYMGHFSRLQSIMEERKRIVNVSDQELLRVDNISLEENVLNIRFTSLVNGIEVNRITLFLNHKLVGSCEELNCQDDTGNGYLVQGEGGNIYVEYNGPCDVSVLLEYRGSTASLAASLCYWTCRRPITISSTFSEPAYPVHVLLTTDNFDFSKTDGSDIRFATENGTKLDYWIEYWTNTSASIWVEVNVVAGEENIYMYYCNPYAASESNGQAVFTAFNVDDTNLLAVFHFDEGAGTIVYDETGRFRGTFIGQPRWVPGRFGYALEFNSENGLVTDFNAETVELTYLVWVRAYAQEENFPRILYDGNYARTLGLGPNRDTYPYLWFSSPSSYGSTRLDANWHSLVAVVSLSGGYQALYVDGSLEANTSIDYVSGRETNLYIASDPSSLADLNGAVDEVILYGRVLSQQEIETLLSGYFDRLTSVWVVRKRIDPEPSVVVGAEEGGQWIIN